MLPARARPGRHRRRRRDGVPAVGRDHGPQRVPARLRGDPGRLGGRRPLSARPRRLRLLRQRPQRRAPPSGGARLRRASLLGRGVGWRRGRRVRRRRARGACDPRRRRERGRRRARTLPGAVRALRPHRGARPGTAGRGAEPPARVRVRPSHGPPLARGHVRPHRAPPHARVRHHASPDGARGRRGAGARAAESARRDARAPAPARPACRRDCGLETDGACALILVSAERAPYLRRRPVHILAAAEGGEGVWGASLYTHAAPAPPYPSANLAPVARRLWAMAGCGPADIDVAQIYENFTGMVLLALEDLGFCARGEGGPFVEDGKLEGPAGALPLNTAGGNLAEAYVHGLNLVLEGVRQMRGESTCQVRDAELSLVAGGPGVAPTSALVLRRG